MRTTERCIMLLRLSILLKLNLTQSQKKTQEVLGSRYVNSKVYMSRRVMGVGTASTIRF